MKCHIPRKKQRLCGGAGKSTHEAGAVSTAVTKGRRSGTMPFETRTCSGCSARGADSHIEDAQLQHVCFECPCIKDKLAGMGWDNTPGGAGTSHNFTGREM